nr:hypothetical protein [Tanacetum cinerariifolium]
TTAITSYPLPVDCHRWESAAPAKTSGPTPPLIAPILMALATCREARDGIDIAGTVVSIGKTE